MNLPSLMLTVIAGAFFLIGYFLTLIFKNKQKIIDLSLGMAFSVIILIAVFELNIEAMEKINDYFNNHLISIGLMIGFILVGMLIFKIFDKFIPHHNHCDENHNHAKEHLYHIGLVTSIFLIVHNIIEGMSVYSIGLNDFTKGLTLAIAIGLHNIPFGIQVSSMIGNNKYKKIILILALMLSTVLGGVLIGFVHNMSELLLGILISVVLGMVIYIVIFELIKEIKQTKNKKNIYLGMVIGCIIMIINFLLN